MEMSNQLREKHSPCCPISHQKTAGVAMPLNLLTFLVHLKFRPKYTVWLFLQQYVLFADRG